MRLHAKVDHNQAEIVKALRQMGCSVWSTAPLGNGFPDIIVGHRGRNYLFEIKNPELSPSKRRLTPQEEAFHLSWHGHVCVIESVEEFLYLDTKF